MNLSDETLAELFALNSSPEKIIRVLRMIEMDAFLTQGRGQGQQIATLANLIEGDVPLDDALAFVSAQRDLPTVERYRRNLPANWKAVRARIFERDGEVCAYCATTVGPFHIDHVAPLRKGGTNEDDNLCVACVPCNLSKKDRAVEEWRARTCS